MTDTGPFSVDHDPARDAIQVLANQLLAACYDLAVRTHTDPLPAPGVPGASVEERSAMSISMQALFNAAQEAGHKPFNVFDGWAYGIAASLAQMPELARSAALRIIVPGITGYEKRVRGAMRAPPERPS